MTEEELILGLLKKDEQAFRTLVEKYQNQVYRTSLGLLQNTEDAEDITQEVFIEVFHSINTFRGDARLSTWLYRLCVNKSLNLIRKNKRREWIIPFENLFRFHNNEDSELNDKISDNHDIPMEGSERTLILDKAIASLPENQRLAFTLHKIEELPHKEIAQIMDNSVSSVESLIFRAKLNLQKKLSAYFK